LSQIIESTSGWPRNRVERGIFNPISAVSTRFFAQPDSIKDALRASYR
jgi:hypothetical protein